VGVVADAAETGLVKHRLNGAQVLAQSIGMMGPGLDVAVIFPGVAAVAGGATWLSVVIATVGMLAMAWVIAVLANRHVSTGGLYTLIAKGLGPTGGLIAAGGFWFAALTWQLFIVLGFGAAFAQFLASAFNIGHAGHTELLVLDLVGVAAAVGVALGGISLSTTFLLALEGVSVTSISILLVVVLFKHGHVIDFSQLRLHGGSVHGVLAGAALVVLAFAGFESATTLGVEAKRPRRVVPLAMIGSIAVVGLFFIVSAYIQTLGFEGTGLRLASQTAPLGTLASHYGVKWLGDIVLLGVSMSWFGVICAWSNYAPRPTLTMAAEGVLPRWLGRTSSRSGVPVAALLFWAATWLVGTLVIFGGGVNLAGAYGRLGTLSAYGATLLYLLAAIAAIVYAIRHHLRRASFVAAAAVSGAVMVYVFKYWANPDLVKFAIFVGVLLVGSVAGWRFAPDRMRRIGTLEESSGDSDRNDGHHVPPVGVDSEPVVVTTPDSGADRLP
jgi:amino acid transporter